MTTPLNNLPVDKRRLIHRLIEEGGGSDLLLELEQLDDHDLFELSATLEEFGPGIFIDAHRRGIIDWAEIDTSWTLLELNYDVNEASGRPFTFVGPITIEEAEGDQRWIDGLLDHILSSSPPATK